MSSPTSDPVLTPGTIVGGRYRVIQDVGEGPLDQLYEAQDVDLHERVILRIIRASLADDHQTVCHFEEQARVLNTPEEPVPHRVIELSRDEEFGPFATISNPESRPVEDVLPLLAGVDGTEAPPPPVVQRDMGYDFPDGEGDVELDTLLPATHPGAPPKESPRYAVPKRPKKLDTLELEPTPRRRRRAFPTLRRGARGGLPLGKLLPIVAGILLLGVGIVGVVYYMSTRGERAGSTESAADSPSKGPRGRQVKITFTVEPSTAKMRIAGRWTSGNVLLVPASTKPFLARFTARGYAPKEVEVVPDRNRTVLVVLTRKR